MDAPIHIGSFSCSPEPANALLRRCDERNFDSVEVSPLTWLQCLYCVFGSTIVRGWSRPVFSFNFAAREASDVRAPQRVYIYGPCISLGRNCSTPAPFNFSSGALPLVSQPSGIHLLLIFNFPPIKMTRIELPLLSFLAVLSLFVILPLHLRSRNIPFLFVIAWLLVCNTIQGIDAVVWGDNALIRAEGWCDLGE